MHLRKDHTAISDYFDDLKRVEGEILLMIAEINPRTIVDIGIGESTRNFVSEFMRYFVGIDIDYNKVVKFINSLGALELHNLELVCADVLHLPLRSKSIDLAVLHFVLHEIDPKRHFRVLTEVKRTAKYVLIVEPLPNGTKLYQKFWSIWRKAMSAIGRFEEYRSVEYWLQLINQAGMHIIEKKVISWKSSVPYDVLKSLVRSWIREWMELGVPKEFVIQLEGEFLEEARTKGFRWSDVLAVMASSQ